MSKCDIAGVPHALVQEAEGNIDIVARAIPSQESSMEELFSLIFPAAISPAARNVLDTATKLIQFANEAKAERQNNLLDAER